MPKKKRISNRAIDSIIMTGNWEIDPIYGFEQLMSYLEAVEMRSSGMDFKELGYGKARAELIPSIICGQDRTVGRSLLSDPSKVSAGSIAHIKMDGVMKVDDSISSPGIRQVIQDIRSAESNPNIIGTIFEVNSGGGQSVAGSLLQSAIAETKKPFVTWYHLLASAALKATLPSDLIIASSSGMTSGSIGVMMSINKERFNEFKEKIQEFYAKTSQEKNAAIRELQKGNEGKLIEWLNKHDAVFMEEVNHWRILNGDEATIKKTLAGSMFLAQESIERGLTDSIGGFNSAIKAVEELAQSKSNYLSVSNRHSNNQTKIDMNFKSFLAYLIPSLNAKFGLNIKEDADSDGVKEAIEGAQSVADLEESIATRVREELQVEHAASLEQINSDLAALRTTSEEQAETITTLTESRSDLENELAELKGRAAGTKAGSKNSTQPDATTFNTIESWNKARPGGGSKY